MGSNRAVVGACEQYLPHVVRLFDSLNASVSCSPLKQAFGMWLESRIVLTVL